MLFSLSYMVIDYSSGGSIINQHFENGCDSSHADLGSQNIKQVVSNQVQGKNKVLFTHLPVRLSPFTVYCSYFKTVSASII